MSQCSVDEAAAASPQAKELLRHVQAQTYQEQKLPSLYLSAIAKKALPTGVCPVRRASLCSDRLLFPKNLRAIISRKDSL